MRRLTRFEYNNSVRDILLDHAPRPADMLPGEELGNGFGNDADSLTVSRILIDGYRTIAHNISLKVAGDTAAAARLGACPTAQLNETTCSNRSSPISACVCSAVLSTRGDDSRHGHVHHGPHGGGFRYGVRVVIEWMLQSPQFLYRLEFGEPVENAAGLMRPTPYEMATRLSYLFWGSAPDQPLLDAAAGHAPHKRGRSLPRPSGSSRMVGRATWFAFFHGQLYGVRVSTPSFETRLSIRSSYPAWDR